MIYPKKNRLIKWFFRNYFHISIKRKFSHINYEEIKVDENRSILLIANHYSWWDAFLLYWLNERLFHKKFYVMTLEESFYKWSFLKYVGAFSVQKNSRDILKSIDFTASLLADPQNLVLIFPQGKMYSNFTDELQLEEGVLRVLQKVKGDVKTVFAVMFTETFKFNKPSAYIYLEDNTPADPTKVNQAFKQFYQKAKTKQADISY